LLDVSYVLFRRCGRIALIVSLFVAGGLAIGAAVGARYTATVRLVVAPSPDGSGRLARGQAELLRDPGLVRRVLPALRAALPAARPGVLGHALGELGVRWTPPPEVDAAFAERVERALRVRAVGDTDVVSLWFTWDDGAYAARALNLIVAAYQKSGAESVEQREALGRARGRLAAAQAELDTVDRQMMVARPGVDAEDLRAERGRIEARLAGERSAADLARLDRALAQQTLDSVEQTYRTGGWVDGGDGAGHGRGVSAGFTALLEKRQELMADGREDSPEVRDLDREMARAREQNYATARQVAATRVAGLDDRLAKLAAGIGDDEAALRGLDRHVSETDVLAETRRAKAEQVAAAQRDVAAARNAGAAGWQAAGVVSEALPPSEPDLPGPEGIAGLSALLGVAAGVGSAVRAERRRLTVDRASDVTHLLGIELLACLDDMRPGDMHAGDMRAGQLP
jgi:uncharacterized protein involved in exopolysaccharide biosynthesis